MYVNIGENRRARLLNSPAPDAKVLVAIPHGIFVQSEFFNYLWRRVTWKKYTGYLPARLLSAYDPSPILWQQRYGAQSDSVHFCTSTPEEVINFKTDLAHFFAPHQHQLDLSSLFDHATQEAVLRFQLIYGLLMDGVAGPKTKATLITYLPNRYR